MAKQTGPKTKAKDKSATSMTRGNKSKQNQASASTAASTRKQRGTRGS
jgi:hypothetical protein